MQVWGSGAFGGLGGLTVPKVRASGFKASGSFWFRASEAAPAIFCSGAGKAHRVQAKIFGGELGEEHGKPGCKAQGLRSLGH